MFDAEYNNRLPVVYFAHPISGVEPDIVIKYYNDIRDRLGFVCRVQTPMDVIARTDINERKESFRNPAIQNDVITNRDHGFVKDCDVIFVNLSKCTRPSYGSIMEIAWAYSYHKYIIIVMDEKGLHDHGMILGSHPVVYPHNHFEDAINHLIDYCKTSISDPVLRSLADEAKYTL